ncbi:MAG: hypothetical protein IJN50_03555 [Clostridia bacterium]|nr:hypothetical protein [Clostridia bacterium]
MNKVECKKYIRRAFRKMKSQNKSMTPQNLAIEMERAIKEETSMYIAYGKVAMHLLNKSATDITAKQLASEIDIIPSIYNSKEVLFVAEKL